VFVTVDCHPAADRRVAVRQRAAWTAHLERRYSRLEAAGFLRAWSREDAYVPLEAEVDLIRRNGLRVEVLWRRNAFAVVMGTKVGQ